MINVLLPTASGSSGAALHFRVKRRSAATKLSIASLCPGRRALCCRRVPLCSAAFGLSDDLLHLSLAALCGIQIGNHSAASESCSVPLHRQAAHRSAKWSYALRIRVERRSSAPVPASASLHIRDERRSAASELSDTILLIRVNQRSAQSLLHPNFTRYCIRVLRRSAAWASRSGPLHSSRATLRCDRVGNASLRPS